MPIRQAVAPAVAFILMLIAAMLAPYTYDSEPTPDVDPSMYVYAAPQVSQDIYNSSAIQLDGG